MSKKDNFTYKIFVVIFSLFALYGGFTIYQENKKEIDNGMIKLTDKCSKIIDVVEE